ncbi:MAG: GTP 3',8-cyclase MoaA [Anaerolineaceae bacterium]|nr:GTP 3',8-cyclase MoaA [Anaerolineaceae bacterium]
MSVPALSRTVSLRLSVTDRCQMRCAYCMPAGGIEKIQRQDVLSFEEIVRFVRAVRSRFAVSKVHITGGEPLARSGIVDLVAKLANLGLEDLALTTNGQLLADMAGDLRRAGLRRVNVSLDSLDEATYRAVTRNGRLQPVLEGIEAALRHGLNPVKLNTVVLKGLNDHEVVDMARFGLACGCPVRFLELMPIGCAAVFDDLFVPSRIVRSGLERVLQLRRLPHQPGASSRNFLAVDREGQQGIVGFISPNTEPFCQGCNRLRLTSEGRLISCLARGRGPRIRSCLRGHSGLQRRRLVEIIEQQVAGKCDRAGYDTPRFMAAVGG